MSAEPSSRANLERVYAAPEAVAKPKPKPKSQTLVIRNEGYAKKQRDAALLAGVAKRRKPAGRLTIEERQAVARFAVEKGWSLRASAAMPDTWEMTL